jgi:hypothetical protein
MTTKFNWWVEILDVDYDFILGIKDILGTIDHEDAETGDATGTLHPGNGINYALLAVWIRGCAGDNNKTNIKVRHAAHFHFCFFFGNLINFFPLYFYFYFFRYIYNMKLRQP